ncbi:hypothetical protein WKI71_44990 [Streptomyces sp. MS1.AVA.1]|uniref:Uncharacterized protein n=1 Tax=Streptomyces machairae TaxID=3134109 RepID=A0ABU8UVN5_9ACTN
MNVQEPRLAAESEAVIGGDLCAATRAATGTRPLIGDVRGKDLDAVGEAALVLGVFHSTAHRARTLSELPAVLDGVLDTVPAPRDPHRIRRVRSSSPHSCWNIRLRRPDRMPLPRSPAPVVVRDGRPLTPALPEP